MSRPAPRTAVTAATAAAVLLSAVAALQSTAAAGAPVGAHLYGGRVATASGVLPTSYRAASAGAAVLLLALAVLLLARVGLVGVRLPPVLLRRATWGVVAFMVLNTAGNAASTSGVERWGLGSLTVLVAALAAVCARAPLPVRPSSPP